MTEEPILTHQCFCGSYVFKVLVSFDDYEIASYSTDMYCAECGMYYKTPTPIDNPEYMEY